MGEDARMAAALARVPNASRGMQSATEALNKSLVAAEKTIAGLNLGVRASAVFPHDPSDDPDWIQLLTFGKLGNDWRLLLESGPAGDSDQWESSPLMNASRETRMNAVSLLPELVERLVSVAEEEAGTIAQRAADVLEFVSKIGKGPQK